MLQTSTGTTLKPAILLLEEYGALAAAISSALKKFAPDHATHVARSLKEAEAIAKDVRPELLLIDVDPPWPKLTQLLGKLRTEHPDARVLIIGATIPSQLIENRGSHRALQFLEKPFDVPELGAAVQALLGPWKESESENLRGTLRWFSAVDAALLQCASGRTVVVEVKKNGGAKSGELHFVDGQLFHAQNGKRAGVEALEELFSWPQPDLREKEKGARPAAKRTIPAPWTEAFLEALQKAKIHQPVPPPKPAPKPVPVTPAPKTGKKVVLVDDTEMLLIFVEDVLSMEDRDLQITTASSGASGVKEIERVRPDLVLLDFSLPDFNGDEVCRRLLENEQTANIPVLMMSGHAPEMMRASTVLENVVATIEKPFLSEALVAIVQQTLKAAPELRRKKSDALRKTDPLPASPPPAAAVKMEEKKSTEALPAVPTARPRSQRTTTVAPPSSPAESQAEAKEKTTEAAAPREAVVVPPPPVVPERPPAPAPPKPAVRPPPLPPQVRVQPAPPEQPVPQVVRVAPPVQQIPRPGITMDTPVSPPAPRPAMATPVLTAGMNDVVLGLFLEVVSMELSPTLRMRTIRARPSSLIVSLHVASPALRAALPPNGFHLGGIDLDRAGRMAGLRLIPTVQPFTSLPTQNAFQIGSVSVLPANSHERLQLTPAATAPMRMHLLAQLEVAGVELSSTFQIAQLVLKNRTHNVRVTLNAQALGQEQAGTICEIAAVQMDAGARLSELTLIPVS